MKYLFFLFLFTGFLSITPAQDTCKTATETHHGLQFQIGSMLNLTSFENYTFSYRYRIDKKTGFRAGILTSLNNRDYDITQQVDTITIKPPNYEHHYNFKLSVQYLYGLVNYKTFTFILGGGPFISFYKNESSSESVNSSYTRETKYKNSTTGYGLDLILGTEFQLLENVLLSGEYSLTIAQEKSDIESFESYTYADQEQNIINRQNGTMDGFAIGGSGVNLGISIFF